MSRPRSHLTPLERRKLASLRLQRARRQSQDFDVPRCGREKQQRIDLGISLLHAIALPGIRYSRTEIAAWAGCTDAAILLIEQRALRKLRRHTASLLFRDLAGSLQAA